MYIHICIRIHIYMCTYVGIQTPSSSICIYIYFYISICVPNACRV